MHESFNDLAILWPLPRCIARASSTQTTATWRSFGKSAGIQVVGIEELPLPDKPKAAQFPLFRELDLD
jgi:hypothetical protein